MDYKKTKADTSIQTRNLNDFSNVTGNVYETIAMLSKRSDQIAADLIDGAAVGRSLVVLQVGVGQVHFTRLQVDRAHPDLLHLRRQVQRRDLPALHPRAHPGRGHRDRPPRRDPGLHRAGLPRPVPRGLFLHLRGRRDRLQRDQHDPGLHEHLDVSQAVRARRPVLSRADRPSGRACDGGDEWIIVRSACSTRAWAG